MGCLTPELRGLHSQPLSLHATKGTMPLEAVIPRSTALAETSGLSTAWMHILGWALLWCLCVLWCSSCEVCSRVTLTCGLVERIHVHFCVLIWWEKNKIRMQSDAGVWVPGCQCIFYAQWVFHSGDATPHLVSFVLNWRWRKEGPEPGQLSVFLSHSFSRKDLTHYLPDVSVSLFTFPASPQLSYTFGPPLPRTLLWKCEWKFDVGGSFLVMSVWWIFRYSEFVDFSAISLLNRFLYF